MVECFGVGSAASFSPIARATDCHPTGSLCENLGMAMKQLWHQHFLGCTAFVSGALLIGSIGTNSLNAAQATPGQSGAAGNASPFDFGAPASGSNTPDIPAPQTPSLPQPNGAAPLGSSSTVPVPPGTTVPGGNSSPNDLNPAAPFGTPQTPDSGITSPSNPSITTGPNDTLPGMTAPNQTPGSETPGATPGAGGTGAPPEQSPPDTAAIKAAIDSGKTFLKDAKYEEAIQQFQTAIKGDPQEPLGYFLLGVATRMVDKFDDSIEAFTAAIDRLPDDDNKAVAYLRRGIVWFNKGDYGIAWDDFDEAAGLLVDQDPLPELWKGLALAKQKKWQPAVNCYAQALELNPKFVPAYVNRGLAYLQLNEPDKAAADFNQAVRREPKNPENYFKLGIAFGRAGMFKEAAHAYSQAIRLKPDFAEALFNRSHINDKLGDSKQAEKDRAAAAKINGENEKQKASAG
jgi:Flp pilus assembly protein TadD